MDRQRERYRPGVYHVRCFCPFLFFTLFFKLCKKCLKTQEYITWLWTTSGNLHVKVQKESIYCHLIEYMCNKLHIKWYLDTYFYSKMNHI